MMGPTAPSPQLSTVLYDVREQAADMLRDLLDFDHRTTVRPNVPSPPQTDTNTLTSSHNDASIIRVETNVPFQPCSLWLICTRIRQKIAANASSSLTPNSGRSPYCPLRV